MKENRTGTGSIKQKNHNLAKTNFKSRPKMSKVLKSVADGPTLHLKTSPIKMFDQWQFSQKQNVNVVLVCGQIGTKNIWMLQKKILQQQQTAAALKNNQLT